MGDDFYAIIKLISGEEILSLVCVDETNDQPIIILHSPVVMNMINHPGGASYVKVKAWIELADDDMFVLQYDRILTITECRDEKIISIYDRYVQESHDDTIRFKTNNINGKVPINQTMGYISTVEDARKKLEDIFKLNIKES
tara:strand:+ start:567 stop:992 length:426 start_codon:yes stop_codon:yes gene_type:complete